MSISNETLAVAKSYTNKYLTSGSSFKGLITDTLPTVGDVGDYYIFSSDVTISTINYNGGDKYMKSEGGWIVVPGDNVTINTYMSASASLEGLTLGQIDNGDGSYTVYADIPEVANYDVEAVPVTSDGRNGLQIELEY